MWRLCHEPPYQTLGKWALNAGTGNRSYRRAEVRAALIRGGTLQCHIALICAAVWAISRATKSFPS
jgi:hypothetical protein